jgi:hypothetical protein
MSKKNFRIDRRSLLKYSAVASGAIFGGVGQTAAAGDSNRRTPSVEPRTFELDTSGMSDVQEATIRLNEEGTISKQLKVKVPKSSDEVRSSEKGPVGKSYSLNLTPASQGIEPATAEDGSPENLEFTAELSRNDLSADSDDVRTMGGIPDEPDPGYDDWSAFVNTNSQECGALARTKVDGSVYGGDTSYDVGRDMASGDACDGEKWDEKFKAFCDVLNPIPGLTCQVPDAFNTNWYADATSSQDNGGSYEAGTFFTCPNFPAIPDTAFSSQYMKVGEGSDANVIEWKTKTGALNGAAPRDIDLDMNEIVNTITKGLNGVLGVGTVGYSWAVTTYLLGHNADVVYS